MKLNYRDRMILLGVLAVVIILVGIFALIRPKAQEIKTDNVKLQEVQTEWDGIEAKFNQIKPLQEAILSSYDESQKLCADFVDVSTIDSTYELDQFMQPYVDQCNLTVKTMDLGSTGTTTLDYYYFAPSVLTSSMFDAADINGNYQTAIDSAMSESNSLSERTKETVVRTQYGILARGTREDIWAFMDEINNLNTAILIDTVNISDYTFGEEAQSTEGAVADNMSDVTFVISLYSVFEMDKPVVE